MNILEAAKSGKEFKRPYHRNWFKDLTEVYNITAQYICLLLETVGGDYRSLFKEDFFADDWIIKED
jgi:hypothetical protein